MFPLAMPFQYLIAFLSLAVKVAAEPEVVTTSTCYYTSSVSDTTSASVPSFSSQPDHHVTTYYGGLTFYVRSDNEAVDGRQLQFRDKPDDGIDPAFRYSRYSFHYVGLDAHDDYNDQWREWQTDLREGTFSTAVNTEDAYYGIQKGFLKFKHSFDVGDTTQYTFTFGNTTLYPPALDSNWYLEGDDNAEHPDVYHEQPYGLRDSFALCQAEFSLEDGPWLILSYFTYSGTPAEVESCELIRVEAEYTY